MITTVEAIKRVAVAKGYFASVDDIKGDTIPEVLLEIEKAIKEGE